jgi:hypothetical protein
LISVQGNLCSARCFSFTWAETCQHAYIHLKISRPNPAAIYDILQKIFPRQEGISGFKGREDAHHRKSNQQGQRDLRFALAFNPMDPFRRDIVVSKSVSILIALILAQSCAAGIVFQDGFESGNLNLWQISGSSNSVKTAHQNQLGGGSLPAANGVYLVLFSAGETPTNGELSVVYSTVVGQTYDLSFDFGTFAGQPQSIRVTVSDATNSSMILDRSITDPTGTFNLANLFDHYSYQFIASSHLTRLKFNDISLSGHDSDGALDNVLVTYSSTVPEPSSAAITAAFLMGSAWRCRQRRKLI